MSPSLTETGGTWPHGPRQLVSTLAWLRLCAVAGQALTVAFVAVWLDLPIAVLPLTIGIAVLAAFALFAFWRLMQPWPVGSTEAVVHIAIDTIVLGYLLYLTGGATNPFVSLLVMPITLTAAALPRLYVAAVATLAATTYLVLLRWYLPLPYVHGDRSYNVFNLHVAGMAISFVITAGLLGFFIAGLAGALRARQAASEHERERALRDEGILAIATQAAGTAHELNTPLSTMRTLLTELRREHGDQPQLAEDLALLAGQADRCRDILRELVAVGRNQLAGKPERTTIGAYVDAARRSFALLRPEIELDYAPDEAVVDRAVHIVPALRHALINLLNNAGDASRSAGELRVALQAAIVGGWLELRVRDYGPGLDAPAPGGASIGFFTTKRDGLGLGLALTKATAERLGGELVAQRPDGGGTLQRLRLPVSVLENAGHDV